MKRRCGMRGSERAHRHPSFAWVARLFVWLAMSLPLFPSQASQGATAAWPWRVNAEGDLVDSHGARVLVNGEAVWSMAVALRPEEADRYLDNRRRLGVNVVMLSAIEHHFSGGPRNAMGDLPFADTPFVAPQERYFRHLDWLLDAAARRGIVVILAPAYLGFQCGEEGWCAEVKRTDPATMRAYGRFLGTRYRDRNNIIWLHGGDVNARAYGVMPQVEALAQGIRETAPDHLHTAHCHRQTLGSECYPWRWMQIDSVYADCPTVSWITGWARARSQRPFLLIEGRYENLGASAQCLRAQFFTSVLGGGVGQLFGTKQVRVFLPGWPDQLDSPGALELPWMMQLLQSHGAAAMVPVAAGGRHGSVAIVSDPSDRFDDAHVAAASRDGSKLLVYVPSPRTLRIADAPGARAWCGTWVDLVTRHSAAAPMDRRQGHWTATRPFGLGDSLLVAQRCAASAQQVGARSSP